jgi:hypothetical protein
MFRKMQQHKIDHIKKDRANLEYIVTLDTNEGVKIKCKNKAEFKEVLAKLVVQMINGHIYFANEEKQTVVEEVQKYLREKYGIRELVYNNSVSSEIFEAMYKLEKVFEVNK